MKPIERISITDTVVEIIKNMIVSGELAEGEKLKTEKELGEELKVGRSTVREAFWVLKTQGYIAMKHGKGAFVARREIDVESFVVNWFRDNEIRIHDFLEVRRVFEPFAVKLAITRATSEEVAGLVKIHENFEKAMEEKDTDRLIATDGVFHNEIVRATHNIMLISINENLNKVFAEYWKRSYAVKDNNLHALEPHRKIMEAFKTRSPGDGESAMFNHLAISMRDFTKVINKKNNKMGQQEE